MKKIFTKYSVSIIILIFFASSNSIISNAEINKNIKIPIVKATIIPCRPIIEWRYKMENGKLYKRLYDYTNVRWVGEWELVG